MEAYVERLLCEIRAACAVASQRGLHLQNTVDSIFLGGGTPSLLSSRQMESIFSAIRSEFQITAGAEITLEAAPGQIAEDLLDSMLRCGVNRVSLGVQSFVDAEARAVGRLHTGQECLAELERLRTRGVPHLNVDLIAGLPHQTAATLQQSLIAAAGSGVEHVSVYMLEVDEDSRLGEEVQRVRAASQLAVLGQQARYSAGAVPDDNVCAELYLQACEFLTDKGYAQYEISNFARPGYASQHNRKYWERRPYLGLGLDAHSMLMPVEFSDRCRAVRFANPDDLETYLLANTEPELEPVDALASFEESVFLGLRLSEGIQIASLRAEHSASLVDSMLQRSRDMQRQGLMTAGSQSLALTAKGRLLSSSVFGELLAISA